MTQLEGRRPVLPRDGQVLGLCRHCDHPVTFEHVEMTNYRGSLGTWSLHAGIAICRACRRWEPYPQLGGFSVIR